MTAQQVAPGWRLVLGPVDGDPVVELVVIGQQRAGDFLLPADQLDEVEALLSYAMFHVTRARVLGGLARQASR